MLWAPSSSFTPSFHHAFTQKGTLLDAVSRHGRKHEEEAKARTWALKIIERWAVLMNQFHPPNTT